MSVLGSTEPPRTCSGAIYAGVPMRALRCVRRESVELTPAARPKSTILTRSCSLVAPHQTVVRCSCKANGGPDILLVAMFSTHSQEERHGPHECMLPESALPCQRPH